MPANTPQSEVSVSIIIPCYNGEAFVGEAIESALAQTHNNTEVVVIDDGSTDGSLDVIRSFESQIVWRRQENQGAPIARNYGLGLSQGRFVKFLDADNVLAEKVIARQIQQSMPFKNDRAIVFGDGRRVGDTKEAQGENGEATSLTYLVGDGINTVRPLHRRDLLEEVGGFARGLSCGQEYEMHIRMKLKGIDFHYRPGAVLKCSYQNDRGISVLTFAGRNPAAKMQGYMCVGARLRETFQGGIPHEVSEQLAQRWWTIGRQALRGGHENEARQCFEEARALNRTSVQGSPSYRLLNFVFGPFFAESVGLWVKSQVSSLTKS